MAWFLEAAKNGFYPSAVNLGMLFLTGYGDFLPNPMVAYMWLRVARKRETSPELEAAIKRCEELLGDKPAS